MINYISHNENAETLERIRTETKKDNILRKLTSHVINNDWIKAEKDLAMAPYIKEEISIIEGIVYKGDKIIISNSLQEKDSTSDTWEEQRPNKEDIGSLK